MLLITQAAAIPGRYPRWQSYRRRSPVVINCSLIYLHPQNEPVPLTLSAVVVDEFAAWRCSVG